MTCDITIGNFKAFKCSAATWSRNVDNYCDSAKIKVPAQCMLKKNGFLYSNKILLTGLQFKEGMTVTIMAGYDGNNNIQFKGFIKRINFSLPLEIECEGFSYQLRKIMINKSYENTTVKKILQDIIKGTDIMLSDKIPDIPVTKVIFKNYSALQVLEFMKEKMLLTVHFNLNQLYAGLKFTDVTGSINYQLGWNVIKGNELLFSADKEFANINIQIEKRQQNGTKTKAPSAARGNVNIKVKRIWAIDAEAILKQLADQKKSELNYKGYTGKITAFLKPYAQPGMAANITDNQYPERTGKYFIESVEGEFGIHGGRQKVGIGISL